MGGILARIFGIGLHPHQAFPYSPEDGVHAAARNTGFAGDFTKYEPVSYKTQVVDAVSEFSASFSEMFPSPRTIPEDLHLGVL